jgi:hypothetical protein
MAEVMDGSATANRRPASGAGSDEHRILQRAKRERRPVATTPVVLPGYLRKGDAARYLNISIRTLTDWMRRGIVAYMKLSWKVCLFRQADLDAAMNRYRVNAVGE